MMMSPMLIPIRKRIGSEFATGAALLELSLYLDRAAYCVQDTRELHQRAVAHELDEAARMSSDRRVDQFTPSNGIAFRSHQYL